MEDYGFSSCRHAVITPYQAWPTLAQRPALTPRSTSTKMPVSTRRHYNLRSSRSGLISNSAMKIQKVFQGFLVRKGVNKVKSIAKLIDEVAKRIHTGDFMELIVRDSKERLGVQEKLMNLLLHLDKISSVDFGVRVYRKKVINKAIALQEEVNAVAAVVSSNQRIDSAYQDHDKSQCNAEKVADQDHNVCTVDAMEVCGEESGNYKLKEKKSSSSDTELLENLVEESRRMISIIQMQTQILSSLSTRVGHLERVIAAEK